MPLSLEEVKNIAALARLDVADSEAPVTLKRLNEIFSLIEEMQAVDTEGVVPMSHPQNNPQRLREDCVREQDWRAAFEKIAVDSEAGLYLVPRVIE